MMQPYPAPSPCNPHPLVVTLKPLGLSARAAVVAWSLLRTINIRSSTRYSCDKGARSGRGIQTALPITKFPLSSLGVSFSLMLTWSIAQAVHNNNKLVTTGSQQGLLASVCLREEWPQLPGKCSPLSGYFMASRAQEHWEHWGFVGCIELNHLLGSVYLPHCCSHCVRPQATLCNGPRSQGHCPSLGYLPRFEHAAKLFSFHLWFFITSSRVRVKAFAHSFRRKKGFERKDKYLVVAVVFVFLSACCEGNESEHFGKCNWNAAKATQPFRRLFSHFFSRLFGRFILFLCLQPKQSVGHGNAPCSATGLFANNNYSSINLPNHLENENWNWLFGFFLLWFFDSCSFPTWMV